MSSQLTAFKRIDNALALYYQRLGYTNYHNVDGNGVFFQYIIDEELFDENLPIQQELGDDCDPNDCTYSLMVYEREFPVPHYVIIDDKQKETFIFYILQYCWKHGNPPSDKYIQEILIRKVGGSIRTEALDSQKQVLIPMDRKEDDEEEEYGYLSDADAETIEDDIKEGIPLKETRFKPQYPARAHLNIFTRKELRDVIDEEFDSELILDYYMDISTALQINDHQITQFTFLMNDGECKLNIINYDLHIKGSKQQCLYGVIRSHDNYKIHQFMTTEQIERKYQIKQHELPKSSGLMTRFQKQLDETLMIEESLIDNTDWFTVQQIKSLKHNVNSPEVLVTLSKEMWIKECKKSFENVDLPLIPVVVNNNNNYWIEWIKIVYIESQNIYVGISCKCNQNNNKWSIQSIYLDCSDMYNKYQLVGLNWDKYNEQLKNLKTSISITEIRLTDDENIQSQNEYNTMSQDEIYYHFIFGYVIGWMAVIGIFWVQYVVIMGFFEDQYIFGDVDDVDDDDEDVSIITSLQLPSEWETT